MEISQFENIWWSGWACLVGFVYCSEFRLQYLRDHFLGGLVSKRYLYKVLYIANRYKRVQIKKTSPQNNPRAMRTDITYHISASSFQASITSKITVEIDSPFIRMKPPLRVPVHKGLRANLLDASGKVTTKLELRNRGLLAWK